MLRLIAACLLATILVGCGQSGPLYLPGNPSEVRQSVPEDEKEKPDEDAEEPKG